MIDKNQYSNIGIWGQLFAKYLINLELPISFQSRHEAYHHDGGVRLCISRRSIDTAMKPMTHPLGQYNPSDWQGIFLYICFMLS
jgi:hypothetical protein